MTVIKKIIFWIIDLIRSLFKKKKKTISRPGKELSKLTKVETKSKLLLNGVIDDTMPSYMILNPNEIDKLIYDISLVKNVLLEEQEKVVEIEKDKLIKEISDKHGIKINEILDRKDLEEVIKELDSPVKKEIINKYDTITERDKEFKVHLKEVDKVINKVQKQEISVVSQNEIEDIVSDIVNDKKLGTNIEEKVDTFNDSILKTIDTCDEEFLKSVIEEYQEVNYITVTSKIIDKNINRYKKIEEDFINHRFTKSYYEREINKIKRELKQIQSLKNKKEVHEHIEKLKKELFTKSKDKYDLLYNNEIFMKLNKECDTLLDKVNAKVIDIKKVPEKKEEEQKDEEEIKRKRIENIIKRFQDMELARRLIMRSREDDIEYAQNDEEFLDHIFDKYQYGVEEDFNFQRNRRKTELVMFFNGLNMAIGKKSKEPVIPLEHINFRMKDLEEAVDVKTERVKTIYHYDNVKEEQKPVEKIKVLDDKPKNISKKERI